MGTLAKVGPARQPILAASSQASGPTEISY